MPSRTPDDHLTRPRPCRRRSGLAVMIVVCLMAMLLSCPAVMAREAQPLRSSNSRHYRVHSTARQAEVDFIKRYMDMLFETYRQRFTGFNARDREPMNLYLFENREQYQQFLTQEQLGVASTSGGVFFVNAQHRGLATYIEARDPEWTLQTLRHEGFHQFAFTYIGPNLPLWVNEGLAEYFGEGIVIRGRIRPGIVPQRRLAALRQAIADNTVIDFPDLIAMESPQWQKLMETRADHGAMLYNQSWAMTHFLIHAEGGRYAKAFAQYLTLLSQDVPSTEAFTRAFGGNDVDRFRQRWEQYVAGLEPDMLSSTLDDLRFLAIGLRLLSEQDEPAPRTFHHLKRRLQQGRFHITHQGHGQNYRVDASDDDLFSYTLPNGQARPYLMLEPTRRDLPPRLSAPGLSPEPTLNWTRNDKGELVFRIDFR